MPSVVTLLPAGMKMVVGAVALIPALMATGQAQAADFYKDKRIIHYITSGSGGSVDLMNRLGARHVGRHIPGKPRVIAKNKTGAGGVVGANYMYLKAPKDGTETMGSLMSVPMAPMFYGKKGRGKNIKFDSTKFNWIGAPARFVAVAQSWHTSKVKKWQDLLTTELIVGSSGMGSSSTVDAIFLNNLLGFKYRVIIGYPGGGDIDLAMVRGETEGRANNSWAGITSRHPDWLRDKKVIILYQQGLEKDPNVPANVPLLLDQISDPDKKALLKLKMAQYSLGYPVYTAPGVPKERVAILRKAYAATYKDPKYLAEAKKARVIVGPISAEKLTKLIKTIYSASPELQAELRANLKSGKLKKAKTFKVSSFITARKKKGKVIVFMANGKTAHAKIGKKTKVYINKKRIKNRKAKVKALKTGMNCKIVYYGEMSSAKSVKCN
jgi:tripartite-type tricarboxylate transporter receptor subunit TctC